SDLDPPLPRREPVSPLRPARIVRQSSGGCDSGRGRAMGSAPEPSTARGIGRDALLVRVRSGVQPRATDLLPKSPARSLALRAGRLDRGGGASTDRPPLALLLRRWTLPARTTRLLQQTGLGPGSPEARGRSLPSVHPAGEHGRILRRRFLCPDRSHRATRPLLSGNR